MAAVVDVRNPVDVRIAGLRALNVALGYEGTQAFISQSFGGSGDSVQRKYERPEPTVEELMADLKRVDAEMRAAGRYNAQKIA